MNAPESAAVLGLGLIGGSIARDLTAHGIRVAGYDRDPAVLEAARAEGAVHDVLNEALEGLDRADLVVLAMPVDAALAALERIANRFGQTATVTDVGSVKRPIQARAVELGIGRAFVGSHPFAGDHRSGWQASRTGLFEGETVFVCPTPASAPEAVATVTDFWSTLGARTEIVDAATHDARMAWVSHLPQLAASALARAIAGAELLPRDLGPGGRDTTRLAASSPEMWAAISTANADELARALERLRQELASFAAALERSDQDALRTLFQRANDWFG